MWGGLGIVTVCNQATSSEKNIFVSSSFLSWVSSRNWVLTPQAAKRRGNVHSRWVLSRRLVGGGPGMVAGWVCIVHCAQQYAVKKRRAGLLLSASGLPEIFLLAKWGQERRTHAGPVWREAEGTGRPFLSLCSHVSGSYPVPAWPSGGLLCCSPQM